MKFYTFLNKNENEKFISERISQKKLKDINLLDNEICSVIFKKIDGSIRRMKGTRNLKEIPKDKHPLGTGIHKNNITPIFDLNLNDWRSFRNENIIQCIKFTNNIGKIKKVNLK